ncbi:EamA family transporter [Flavobacterium aquicola]|uniref:Chloramphenicol-sensitive protein RarD n=1 Tax=Flavobacterium aquicola TaxID=1682742 RepID=A0A3E0ERL4_9FLAO|nr:EamA family transporter [Flavobacterium aquicola]REG99786.1 chloramphenicol-sensitive protein RarD [Flavobacterium aquicola]
MKKYNYYLAAFTAFFIWGFFSLALKPIASYPSLDILFYRVFFSVVTLTAINLIFRRKNIKKNWADFSAMPKEKKQKITLLTLVGGIILASNWLIFIYVINHVNVKAGSLAYLICPILTTVFAFFLLKEKLNKWKWIAVCISTISCILLSLNHFQDILYSLLVASTYALYLVSQRKNSEIDKFLILNIQLLFIALLILPFYPAYSGAVPTEPVFYVCLFCIVVLFTIIPLFLNLYALKGLDSSTVGILMYTNPIINFTLAVFYFKEEVSVLQMISYSLILISIVIFNKKLLFGKKNKSKAIFEDSKSK